MPRPTPPRSRRSATAEPAAAVAVAEPEPDAAAADEPLYHPGQWEWVQSVPTYEEITEKLATLSDVWDTRFADYAPFVQALPSERKVKVRRGNALVEQMLDVVNVYMTVAGRIQQCNDAQQRNGWTVDFVPEEATPPGCPPGYIRWDDERLVYRVWVIINVTGAGLLGRRSGTAWVPTTGGRAAARTNPYEKVETSALGRALGGWGFGVLPGSGVASYEEMLIAAENAIAVRTGGGGQQQSARREAPTPADLIETIMDRSAKIATLRGDGEGALFARLAEYAQKSYGVDIATARDQDGKALGVDLSKLRPAQLRIFGDSLGRQLARMESDQGQPPSEEPHP